MKKLVYILVLLLTPLLVAGQTSGTLKLKRINNISGGWIFFDEGDEIPTGSEAVAQRLAHEVFVGVGKPQIKPIGPNPQYGKPIEKDPEMESWILKPVKNSNNLFAIHNKKTYLAFTAKPSGKIGLDKYQPGNKKQHFSLVADTTLNGSTVHLKCEANGLVATVSSDGPLTLTPPQPKNKDQLWYGHNEEFYDLVYKTNGPDWYVAFDLGVSMYQLKKHEKARKYYDEAYKLNPDHYPLLQSLGDRYMAYDEEKAAQFYEEAFTHNNNDAEFCVGLGKKAVKANVANGLKYLRRANELEPGLVDFTELAWFHNGMAVIGNNKDKYGAINLKGELLTNEWFDDYYQTYENIMLSFKKNGKWRFLSNRGLLIDIPFDGMGSTNFQYGIESIQNDDKWGVIDTTGQIILPFEYENAKVAGGMILVKNDQGKYTVYSGEGKPLTDEWFENGWAYPTNPLPALKKDGKWRFINSKGEFIKGEYKNIKAFDNGVGFVKNLDDKWGAIDANGDIVVPFKYHGVKGATNGMVAVENEDGEYAVFDFEGNMLSDDWYDDAKVEIGSAMIALKKRKRWFYVSKTQEQVFRKCQDVGPFSEGYAFVKRWGKWGIINEKGEKTANFDFDAYKTNFKKGWAKVEKDGGLYRVDPYGKTLSLKLLEP